MGKFAKLFDLGDEQVLIHTEADAEGNPSLRVVTEVKGEEVELRLSFRPKKEEEPSDLRKAWATCDKAFAALTEDDAVRLREKLVAAFADA